MVIGGQPSRASSAARLVTRCELVRCHQPRADRHGFALFHCAARQSFELRRCAPGASVEDAGREWARQTRERVEGAAGGCHIEHLRAADGRACAGRAEHEPVAGREGNGRRQADAPVRSVVVEEAEAPALLARTDVHVDHAAPGERVAGKRAQRDVDGLDDRPLAGAHDRVAPADLVMVDTRKIQRDAGSRRHGVELLVV